MTYYQKHREQILAQKIKYRQDNADSIKEYQRNYYLQNKELKKQKVKTRYLKKKSDIVSQQVNYRRQRRTKEPFFKMKHNVRSLVSMVLRNRGFLKRSKIASLLGCSYEELKFRIENQFDSTMTWDNYGTVWTYDHICPCAQAQSEEELIKLQHYTNLRPYKDNIRKSDHKTLEGEQLCLLLLKRKWI